VEGHTYFHFPVTYRTNGITQVVLLTLILWWP